MMSYLFANFSFSQKLFKVNQSKKVQTTKPKTIGASERKTAKTKKVLTSAQRAWHLRQEREWTGLVAIPTVHRPNL